ncbi:hypothetical protein BVY01_04500 [bacterium I07]|nr:hypothetical protein BVY01_04500 [bacterium I07]
MQNGHSILIPILFLFIVGCQRQSETTDGNLTIWPQFRGSNCSGHAGEGQNLPVKFSTTQNVFWKTSISKGYSSPCVWENHIFLTGCDVNKKELSVFCLNRDTGTMIWEQVIPVEKVEKQNKRSWPANSTVATDGERIYVYFGSVGLLCYDFVGEQQWTVSLPIPKTRHGMGTSPIVTGELVILNVEDKNDPKIMAFDRRSGNIMWEQKQPSLSKLPPESYSTPVVWNGQLIIYRRGEIVGHDYQTGKRIWWFNTATCGGSTPVIANDILFVETYAMLGEPKYHVILPDYVSLVNQHDRDNNLMISKGEFPTDLAIVNRPEMGGSYGRKPLKEWFKDFDTNKDSLLDKTEWEKTVDDLTAFYQEHGLVAIKLGGIGDITHTHFLWKVIEDIPEVPSPIVVDGNVYMIKNGGIVSCIKADTGKLLFRERLGALGPYFSSPVVADGRIYISSRKGIVTVFEASNKLKILAKNDLEAEICATPAIVDNKLYLRTEEHLYAFAN